MWNKRTKPELWRFESYRTPHQSVSFLRLAGVQNGSERHDSKSQMLVVCVSCSYTCVTGIIIWLWAPAHYFAIVSFSFCCIFSNNISNANDHDYRYAMLLLTLILLLNVMPINIMILYEYRWHFNIIHYLYYNVTFHAWIQIKLH